jgi:16S rRNA G966 N2-methylase RsmD
VLGVACGLYGQRALTAGSVQGAIGLESLSRGCAQAHFVEMDPWVIRQCLSPNVVATGYKDAAVVHTDKVETFLKRAAAAPTFAGGAFDIVSVCPPYMTVSYPEVYALLAASPLITEMSVVLVEYSRQNKADIADTLGPLSMVKNRVYGRTIVAVYA